MPRLVFCLNVVYNLHKSTDWRTKTLIASGIVKKRRIKNLFHYMSRSLEVPLFFNILKNALNAFCAPKQSNCSNSCKSHIETEIQSMLVLMLPEFYFIFWKSHQQ